MKRLILIWASLLIATAAFAQYHDGADELMKMKKGSLWLGEEKITKENVQMVFSDAEYQERWRKANAGYKTGLGLTIGGSALTAAGATLLGCFYVKSMIYDTRSVWEVIFGQDIAAEIEDFRGEKTVTLSGEVMICVGIPVLLAGIPTLCVYNSRMKNLAEDYNASRKSPEVSLNFGNQQHGVGLALNF